MSHSKQARARQERQKERLAVIHARRDVQRRRRKRIGTALVLVIIVTIVGLAFAFGLPGTSSPNAAKASDDCVKFSDTLPKDAPALPNIAGRRPKKLVIQDIKSGSGAVAQATSTVTANYTGVSCSTGKIFDSSWSRGKPADFPVARTIKGWQQGIPGMKVGGRRFLAVPADLAYGDNPPPGIEANEPLFFLVDLVAVK